MRPQWLSQVNPGSVGAPLRDDTSIILTYIGRKGRVIGSFMLYADDSLKGSQLCGPVAKQFFYS